MKRFLRAVLSLSLILSVVVSVLPLEASAASNVSLLAKDYIAGHNVGFYDSSGSNKIETSGDLGVCLRESEWVAYKISGLEAAEYALSISRSCTNQVVASILIDDEAVLSKCVISPTGDYLKSLPTDIGTLSVTKGSFVLKIKNIGSSAFYLRDISIEKLSEKTKREEYKTQSRPYKMSFLPCILEAENFDYGTKNTAYFALDDKNSGGEYRTNTGIDIFKSDDGYSVQLSPTEWVSYTFRVDFSGNYELLANCSDSSESGCLRFYVNDYEVVRNLRYPEIKTEMSEVSAGVLYFPKGVYTLKVKCMEGAPLIDRIRFKRTAEEGVNVTETKALRTWSESQEADEAAAVLEPERHEVIKELYVSAESGSDKGDGSEKNPFKTIQKAQQAVRTMNENMQGDIVVHLTGSFFVDETLTFTEEDSGTNSNLVIWQGEDGATVHGGKKVTGWQAVEGTKLYKTTLPDEEGFRQLYVGENRATRARSKWLYFPIEEYSAPNREKTVYSELDGYVLSGEDFPNDFKYPEDMEFIWLPSWRNVRVPVKSLKRNDDGNLLAVFEQPAFDTAFHTSSPITLSHPFYIENAPELLDEAGEWYFNKETKELFYMPLEGEDINALECYIPKTEFLLTVSGTDAEHKAKNIMFSGISFRYGAWERATNYGFATTQAEAMFAPEGGENILGSNDGYPSKLVPAQIQVNYADGIHFVNNEFAHLGSVALAYNYTSSNGMASGNIFDDVSASAVTVSNYDFKKDDPVEKFCRRITIANNLLRRISVEYMTPAITAYYVNNLKIAHNDILDTPYTGISMGWGWGRGVYNCAYNKIENNRIENVLYKLMDGGHIYTLDPQQGSVISGNYLIKSGEWKGGIYHDNASAYITTRNNVFECYKWYKITWHNIHDNVAYNNYSETPYVVNYPDNNSVSEAIGKTNGEWGEEAQKIIQNAGLDAEHKYLLSKYAEKGEVRNIELSRMPYDNSAGIMIPAGEHMKGEEGETYHEIVSYNDGPSKKGEPDIYDSYNGTGHRYLMATAQGEWTKYEVEIPEDGEYDIILNLAVTGEELYAGVEIDGEEIETEKLHKTCDGYETFEDQHVATVNLVAGKHIIKVEHKVGNFGFWSLRIAKTGEAKKARDDGFNAEILKAVLH